MKATTLKAFSLLFVLTSAIIANGQNVAINTAGNIAETGAILDLSNLNTVGTTGFLPPYVTLTHATTLAPLAGTAATLSGLIVYNTSASVANGLSGPGLYYWNNSIPSWVYLGVAPSGAGTTNYIARWTSATNLGTGVAQDNGTKVGISGAVITPVSLLDVNGNVSIGTYAGITAAPANGMLVSGQVGLATGTPQNTLDVNGQVAIGTYAGTVNAGAGISAIISNNVGIATSTPKNKLDVNGAVAIGTYAGANAAPAGTSAIISGQVGIGNNAPSGNAILDLTNTTTNLAFQLPRLTTAQMTALGVSAADNGLMCYNSTLNCPEVVVLGAWTSLSGNLHGSQVFVGSPSVQTWAVPPCVTTVTVTVVGASGSQNTFDGNVGGAGATIEASFAVTPGEDLKMIAGTEGAAGIDGAGGGGGSFVWDASTTALKIAAGGGGGAGNTGNGKDASLTQTTNDPTNAGNGGTTGTGPGFGGGCGTITGGSNCNGGGGGGWTGNGTLALQTTRNGQGGISVANGGNGGTGAGGGGGNGGFGGGGGAGDDTGDMGGGGGGGGYKGAGGGNGTIGGNQYPGGGGSSYDTGTTVISTSVTNIGDGSVTITW